MSLIKVMLTRLNSLNTWDSPWLNIKFIVGLSTILLVVFFGEFGALFRDTDLAYTGSAPLNLPPMWSEGGLPDYPLGTESNGKDMLAQLILGTSSSLKVGFLAASIGLLIGLILGAAAGYRGGWWDHLIRTVSDAAMTIPSLVVLIVIASFIQMTDTTAMALILALFAWPGPTRMIRSQILSLRERGYVRMARLSGASTWAIMFVEMAPNMMPWLAASLTGGISGAILGATGLEALGLGPTRVPSLGLIINQATTNAALVRGMTWWWLPPILILMVIFAGFFLMTTGLDEIANPRLRRFKPARRDPADRRHRAQESLLQVGSPDIPLQIQNLHVHYATPMGDIAAASGVNLVLNKGEILGLVGESGCGKTTVASAILQVVQPPGKVVDGRVAVNGTDMMGLSERALRQVRWRDLSLVPQGAMNALNPVTRIREQMGDAILAHEAISRRDLDNRIHGLLEDVGLPKRVISMFPHELSGGMKQRVCIAMAIALNPDVVIADEPTSALDVVVQRKVAQTLLTVKERLGMSIIIIGHDMGLLAQMVDRVAIMYAGHIVEVAPVASAFGAPRHPYTKLLIESIPSIKTRRELKATEGLTHDLRDRPQGCIFQFRCPFVEPKCRETTPSLQTVDKEHQVACWMHI